MPAVFKVLDDGSEALVNTSIDGDTIIIKEVGRKFVLRLGNTVFGLENNAYDGDGNFNQSGTSDKHKVRLIQEGENNE